jgi:hypothetical protein
MAKPKKTEKPTTKDRPPTPEPPEIIELETIKYRVRWASYKIGDSFFIPCFNCAVVRAKIARILHRTRYNFFGLIRVENKIKGLRFWRSW